MNPQDAHSCSIVWYKEKPLLFLVLFMSVLYSALSILRHLHFGSNTWDLGIFDQMVWHYSRFEAPASTPKLLQNDWGDHFSPLWLYVVRFIGFIRTPKRFWRRRRFCSR